MPKAAPASTFDPWAYAGPLRRADGKRAYNHYFWPMHEDWYWAYNEPGGRNVSSRFNFYVVALADGRWSTSGSTYEIERNSDHYDEGKGKPVVFSTRQQALRIAAARFIRMCRYARNWTGHDSLSPEMYRRIVNWALSIVDRPAIEFRPLPPPPPIKTGLPLFDLEITNA